MMSLNKLFWVVRILTLCKEKCEFCWQILYNMDINTPIIVRLITCQSAKMRYNRDDT